MVTFRSMDAAPFAMISEAIALSRSPLKTMMLLSLPPFGAAAACPSPFRMETSSSPPFFSTLSSWFPVRPHHERISDA